MRKIMKIRNPATVSQTMPVANPEIVLVAMRLADNIVEAGWSSVSGIIHKGGTIIGSARCKDFRDMRT